MLKILPYIDARRLLSLIILIVIVAFIEILVLRKLTLLINYYLGSTEDIQKIDLIILLTGSFVKLVLGPTLTFLIYKTSLSIQLNISTSIAQKALKVDEKIFNRYPIGHWLNVANVETAQFSSGYINSYIFRAAELCILLSIVSFLVWNIDMSTLIMMLPLVIIVTPLSLYLRILVRRWGRLRQDHENNRIQILKDLLSARNIIINTFFDESFIRRYRNRMKNSNNAQLKRFVGMSVPRYTIELLAALVIAFPIAIKVLVDPSAVIKIDSIAIFGVALLRMLPSINKIISTTNEISFSIAPFNLIKEFLDLPEATGLHLLKTPDEVSLLYFRSKVFKMHSNDNLVLDIRSKEFIALTGPSGAGKSTVLKQLAGLIVDNDNTLLSVKQNVKVGYVSQEPYAFSNSVEYNIFGNKEWTDVGVSAELADFGLEYIKMNDEIGDGGRKLSGGELMRLNLLRAINSGANVICLDETLSSLPKPQRNDIMKFIKESNYFDAVIYVTHNEDDLEYADKVVELRHVN